MEIAGGGSWWRAAPPAGGGPHHQGGGVPGHLCQAGPGGPGHQEDQAGPHLRQEDGLQVPAHRHLHQAGEPPAHPGWRQGVAGATVPDPAPPDVGSALPYPTFKWRKTLVFSLRPHVDMGYWQLVIWVVLRGFRPLIDLNYLLPHHSQ